MTTQQLKLASEIENAISNTLITVGKDAFTNAVLALRRIGNRDEHSLPDWRMFGKTWLAVRKFSNGHHTTMNKVRLALFTDGKGRELVDAQTASYAARLYEDWYDIEYYATDIAPKVQNPRTLVQGFEQWRTMRLRWGVNYVDQLFEKGEKAAIKKVYKAIGKDHEILAIQAAALNGGNGSKGAVDEKVVEEAVKKATNGKAANGKAANGKKTDDNAPSGATVLKVDRKPLSADMAVVELSKLQPILISAINSGEIRGELLDDLDRQISAIRRAIRRSYEQGVTPLPKSASFVG